MEAVFRDYSAKGVRFYYLYKALIHPGTNGYVGPVTLDERIQHIREAKRTLGSAIPWLCDTMDNSLKHALGDAPNAEFVIDPEGRVARLRSWSDPDKLRADLVELAGPVETPTEASSLKLDTAPPPKDAPTGIVPRVRLDGRYRGLRIEPALSEAKYPFYVKLRAEASQGLLRDGKGKAYLGFWLDPIYRVHWNNEVAALTYSVDARVSPARGAAPKVKEPADADPREFVVDVDLTESKAPSRLTFQYYACTEEWCRQVSQAYTIHWEADRDAGWRQGAGAGGPGGGAQGPAMMLERFAQMDKNGDGRLGKDEAPPPMVERWSVMDSDGDGFVTRAELEAMVRRRKQ